MGRYIDKKGLNRSINRFGQSGKLKRLADEVGFEQEAQEVFDYLGDFPEVAKEAFNTFVKGWKDLGFYQESGFYLLICMPTLDADKAWLEIKSKTHNTAYDISGSPTYELEGCHPNPIRGFWFKGNNRYAITDFIPANMQTQNDICELFVTWEDETLAANNFNYGSTGGLTTDAGLFLLYGTGNLLRHSAHAWATNGRIDVAQTSDNAGIYLPNRRSATDYELVKNGVVVGTLSTAQGTPSIKPWYMNTYNNNDVPAGIRSQSPIKMLGNLGKSVPVMLRSAVNSLVQNYLNDTYGLKSLRTNLVVIHGNSHTVYQHSGLARKIAHYYFATGVDVHVDGLGGRTTTQMLADYASTIAPLFDPTLDKCIYLPIEMTNDHWFGVTKEQTLQNYKDLCGLARATGFFVPACPNLLRKRTGGSAAISLYNSEVDWINQQIRDTWETFADDYIEPHPDAWLWFDDYVDAAAYDAAVLATVTDTNIFYDGTTHLTEEKGFVWAEEMILAIDRLLTA